MSVPAVSLAPGPAYRRGVARLLAGLVGFVVVYLGLVIGCVAAIVVVVRAALISTWIWPLAIIAALCFGPLAWFLIRGLGHRPVVAEAALEIETEAHPQLRAFVERLAEHAGVPPPGRISLTHGVNAAMLARLRGGRELVIGLGLVNVLELPAFEAALAHEFGHFAQSSTRVGQWAHRVTIVAREIVLGRTRFDAALRRARRAELGIVRGLAAIVGVGVRGARVILARLVARLVRLSMAMARELEFNADLHAVARCGSDALVEALWHAQRGALAMDAALAQLAELARHPILTDDLYLHQRARLEQLDDRLARSDAPMAAALRRAYVAGPELHFPPGEAPVEVMWYAHPSYRERESNAKQTYVVGDRAVEPSSAWALFCEPQALRRELTRRCYAQLLDAAAPDPEQLRPAAEVEERIVEELAEREQGEHLHGFYENRIIDPGDLDALAGAAEAVDRERLRAAVRPWRGSDLAAFMARWRATEARLDHLRGAVRDRSDPERARAAARELGVVSTEREAQVAEAQAGDRAVLAWLWQLADVGQQTELLLRYRFLAFVQRHIVALNGHHTELGRLGVDPREVRLAAHAPVELLASLDALHRDLSELLEAAGAVEMPRLSNVDGDRSLGSLLASEPLVDPLDHDAELGPWLRRFMAQVGEVHGRLRSLHYKNLGQLLALHERIERIEPSVGRSER